MKFPYQEFRVKPTPEFPKGVLYRPRIPFLAIGPIGELRLEELVDTGSDQTILPRTDLADIGVTVNAKQQSRVRGRLPHYEDNVTRAENIRFAL